MLMTVIGSQFTCVWISDRFAVCGMLYGLSHAILASLATPVILELHGEHRVGLVFGVEMMFYGIAAISSPAITGN